MKIGDLVKGQVGKYEITNEKMTKAVVVGVVGERIKIRILEHEENKSGLFTVESKHFDVIGEIKKFNREEVFELLKKGCKKEILEYNLSGADLSGANLRETDLSEANLSEANLRGADLREANLSEANLRGADLREANLSEANLSEANLRGADLREANLRGANLSEANLRGADLREVNLSLANLRGADLSLANLRRADLSLANLSEANLRGADLSLANLRRADLSLTNLSEANLRGSDLRGANLRGSDLRGANLSEADLSGADLDFSCYPLWCGGLKIKTDKRLACQLAYHLCSLQCEDEEYIKMRNSILEFANQFHRVGECKRLEEIKEEKESCTTTQ